MTLLILSQVHFILLKKYTVGLNWRLLLDETAGDGFDIIAYVASEDKQILPSESQRFIFVIQDEDRPVFIGRIIDEQKLGNFLFAAMLKKIDAVAIRTILHGLKEHVLVLAFNEDQRVIAIGDVHFFGPHEFIDGVDGVAVEESRTAKFRQMVVGKKLHTHMVEVRNPFQSNHADRARTLFIKMILVAWHAEGLRKTPDRNSVVLP